MSYCIAVDGPAGAGKSTIAKLVAKKMGLVYVDTGAMYRAMALFMLREGIAPADGAAIDEKCKEAQVTLRYENGEQVVFLNGENVNAYIRTEEVGNMASAISPRKQVRQKLVSLQKALAENTDLIMDGRDIGTCVLPGADVKIYLTASSLVRAKRRFEELTAKGETCDLEKIKEDIEKRDEQDMTREESPLRRAEDAVLLDSSDLSIEEVVEEILKICNDKKR